MLHMKVTVGAGNLVWSMTALIDWRPGVTFTIICVSNPVHIVLLVAVFNRYRMSDVHVSIDILSILLFLWRSSAAIG